MAVPAYATDLNDIYTDGGTWTVLSGRATDPDTDDYIQGSSCWSHDPFSTGIEGGVVNSAETITAGDAVFIWTKADISPALATHAAGGVQALIGNASTALKCFYVAGSDDLVYGGWKCIPVDPTKTPSTNIGTPTAVTDYFGVRWNVPATGPNKGYPFKIDAMRHGKNLEITAGDSTTPATWGTTAIYDANNARMWGLCQPTDSGAAIQGYIYWGTATTAVYSRDTNKTIAINDTEWTDTDFTQIIFAHASNDVVWDNVGLLSLGTNNRGIIDVTANGTIEWTNSVFQDIDTTALLSSSTFDGSKWISCNEVTAGGASLVNCKILTPTVAISSYGLLWNTATDPDGELDGMEFSKGTTAHHAIQFDATNTPTTITLRGIDFTGFNATNGNNDSALYFPSTTKSYTVNLVGCTGDISYQVGSGGSVTFVVDPVSLTFKVRDSLDNSNLSGARVLCEVTSGVNFPYQASISITGATTTATVTHTAHGLSTNDWVIIRGANEDVYNGTYQITVTGVNAYTYTTNETIGTTPATGTITSTFALLSGTTDVNGEITDSWSITSDQPFSYRVAKGTSEPYFVRGTGTGTLESDASLTTSVTMVRDQ